MKNFLLNSVNKSLLMGVVMGILIGGFLFENHIFKKHDVFGLVEKREGMSKFTNPLLECSEGESISKISQMNVSKSKLENLVKRLELDKDIKNISVYLRDLNNGPWIGIDEKEEFIGGSLLKVPVLISIMKMAENNQSIFDQEVVYTSKIVNDEQYFKPSKGLVVGNTYKVKDLLEYMIYYSDNDAGSILASGLTKDDINSTFESVGLGSPQNDKNFSVTPKVYAGFFRVLFNSSYLSRDFSEATLNMLSQTEFNKGITAKLPSNIRVSHKFGIREENGLKQLHDCGIVYYPKTPYLLCVITKGFDYDKMAAAIANISEEIYKDISTKQ